MARSTGSTRTRGIPPVNSSLFPAPEMPAEPAPKPAATGAAKAAAPPAEPAPIPPDTRARLMSTIEYIHASAIGRDERVNTRPVDYAWVTEKAKTFSWDFLGTIKVSRRDDGSIISLDGQNRLALVAAVGYPDADMRCEVFTSLTLAQEAGLFLGFNDDRAVKPVSKFLALVTMGDPIAMAVKGIADDCSWRISPTGGRGVLMCVGKLCSLHARDLAKCKGGEDPVALRDTLTLITTVWGHSDGAGHEVIVAGLGNEILRDGQIISDDLEGGIPGMKRLADALRREFGAEPGGLLEHAKSFCTTHIPKVGMGKAVSESVIQAYNYRKQGRRLAPWVR